MPWHRQHVTQGRPPPELEAAEEPRARRRRLTSKTPAREPFAREGADAGAGHLPVVATNTAPGKAADHWKKLFALRVQGKYFSSPYVDGEYRGQRRERLRQVVRAEPLTPDTLRELQAFSPDSFVNDPAFALYASRLAGAPDDESHAGLPSGAATKTPKRDPLECLFTWNGPWGLFPLCPVSLSPGAKVLSDEEFEKLRAWLKHNTKYKHLCRTAERHVFDLQKTLLADGYSWALEVAPSTLNEDRVLRVHLHAFVHKHEPIRGLFNRSVDTRFNNTFPHLSPGWMKAKGRKRDSGWHMGHFYCRAPKIGHLASGGSWSLEDEIEVRPQWVMSLYSKRKITPQTARNLFLCSGYQAEYYVKLLAFIETEKRKASLQQRMQAVSEKLGLSLSPAKNYPLLEKEWFPQYDKYLHRFCFLILDGPSRMGKTQWARSLTRYGRALEINCANAKALNLRDYDANTHDVIIADEASPELIISEKKVFQAGNSIIDMASSATSCHAYAVWLWRVKIVVCSNRWALDMVRLGATDAAWIEANSVYLHVTEPMWEVPGASSS